MTESLENHNYFCDANDVDSIDDVYSYTNDQNELPDTLIDYGKENKMKTIVITIAEFKNNKNMILLVKNYPIQKTQNIEKI